MELDDLKLILVPTDFSESSAGALRAAIRLAQAFHAAIEVFHVDIDPTVVLPPPLGAIALPRQFERVLAATAERLALIVADVQRSGVACSGATELGRSHTSIVERAATAGAGMIVMGSHGRQGLSHALLGSVARKGGSARAVPGASGPGLQPPLKKASVHGGNTRQPIQTHHPRTPIMNADGEESRLSKVPEVTIVFWIIKILATTLGETGGDAVSMSMHLGYLVGTGIFAVMFVVVALVQILTKKFHPTVYWTTIIATTTVGTTIADFADRSLGVGYAGGTAILFILLMASLFIWHRTVGSVAVDSVSSPKSETFYWVTIMFSQTLGTALGDWTADTAGLGYKGGALVFSAILLLVTIAYYRTRISRTVLFWAAFIVTRPLGAVLGDLLDKPLRAGGLALSRYTATAVLLGSIAAMVIFIPQKAAQRGH